MQATDVDSGYSWVVAGASFFVYLMMYAVYRLSGVMFVASMPRFGVGREAASFPYTFAGFTKNVTGPVVGFLLHKFSIRTLILSGCILAAIGVGTCFFAENIVTVTVLWGIVFGFGLALSCSLLPVLINDHFLKHRATAAGIAFSGMCVGSMILPPIVEVCIDFYGISGTFLIVSGLLLNCVPLALFLRPRNVKNAAQLDNEIQQDLKQEVVAIVTENTALLTSKSQLHKNVLYYSSISEYAQEKDISNVEDESEKPQLLNKQILKGNGNIYRQTNHYEHVNISNNKEWNDKTTIYCDRNHDCVQKTECDGEGDSRKTINPNLTFDNAGNIYDVPNKPSASTIRETQEYNSLEHIPSKNSHGTSQQLCRGNCALMLNYVYILVVITKAVSNSVSLCLNTVIFDFSRDIGIATEYEKYILIFSSMGELLGRLFLGRMADTRCLSNAMFMVICAFIQSLGALIIGWSDGFYMLGAGLFFFSFMGSIVQFMCPLIIADGIEMDKQAFAITSSSFLAGPATLAISPLIGYLRDDIGSYTYLFYGFGALSILTGITWIFGYFFIKSRVSYTELK